MVLNWQNMRRIRILHKKEGLFLVASVMCKRCYNLPSRVCNFSHQRQVNNGLKSAWIVPKHGFARYAKFYLSGSDYEVF